MKDELTTKETLDRLTQLVSSKKLPARANDQGERLIERLTMNTRIALLGPKGVGKTQLLSALVGREIKNTSGFPLIVSYGSAEGPQRFVENGSSKVFPQTVDRNAPASTEIIQLQLPLSFLENLQFLDVPTPVSMADQSSIVNWALGRADIVLWCTQTFDENEASYWTAVPDHLKDHSFLVLTEADDLAVPGKAHARLEALQAVAQNEFHSFFTIKLSGSPPPPLKGDGAAANCDSISGLGKLRTALTELVHTGRRAVDDAALLLIERYERGNLRSAVGSAKPNATLEIPLQEPPEPEAAYAEPAASGEQRFYHGVLKNLDTKCLNLLPAPETFEDRDARKVLDQCLETCESVADQFADARYPTTDFQRLQDDVAWAADKMLLIAMEEGIGPATDAATILLQIRRELELRVAA